MHSTTERIEALGRRAQEVREQELPATKEDLEIVGTPQHLIDAARNTLAEMRRKQIGESASSGSVAPGKG